MSMHTIHLVIFFVETVIISNKYILYIGIAFTQQHSEQTKSINRYHTQKTDIHKSIKGDRNRPRTRVSFLENGPIAR